MKIAFYSPHLCARGTEVALYDYAHYNETLLGNKSIIIHEPLDARNDETAVQKFKSRFPVKRIDSYSGNSVVEMGKFVSSKLDEILLQEQCDAVYIINGVLYNYGLCPTACKTLIHFVGCFPEHSKYGDAAAYASYWLSDHCSNGRIPAVPHMVDLPEVSEDIRDQLGIPPTALVFGRSGGNDTFDIPWAKQVVSWVVDQRKDVYFLFQNTDKFFNHPRVIHLPKDSDMVYKTKFINSCDAMLHARVVGESFGLSCGEFSIRNKPVITWLGSPEKNHHYILGDRGIYYQTPLDLYNILMQFMKPHPSIDYNCYREYSPEKIMTIFNEVFLR